MSPATAWSSSPPLFSLFSLFSPLTLPLLFPVAVAFAALDGVPWYLQILHIEQEVRRAEGEAAIA